jgi:membrane protease YdiL (CAAX protease family)
MAWDIALILFVLAVIIPWRGRVRIKTLMAMPRVGMEERLALYASTIAFQWLSVAVVAWRAWARGYTAMELGLTTRDGAKLLVVSVVGALTLAGLHWLNLRRAGRISREARGRIQQIAERLLPQSPIEVLCFLALAITAGLCEEFLYRGFAMAALLRFGSPAWLAILASSLLFGLAHLYQGRSGLAGTTLIGVVLGIGRIAYDSLVPVIFWHCAVDVVAGVAGPRYLTGTPANSANSGAAAPPERLLL